MPTILNYDAIPGIIPIYLKILFTRKKGFRPGDTFPDIKASVKNVTVDPKKLGAYREICELEDDGNLPLLYPHVLTAPLHMAILSHGEFPIPLIGILHYRNHLIRHRPIRSDEPLDVEVALTGHRIVKQGLEFDYTVRVESGGELVWNSITTYLKQGRFGKDFDPSPRSDLIEPIADAEKISDSQIPGYIGKRYAKICSDYNLIHISKLAARLFGFKRDIAHAMWAAALSLGKLGLSDGGRAVRVDLAFKGPLFIGSRSYILRSVKKGFTRFNYHIQGNERPCITGKVSLVDRGTML
ncbi:MAG TPA: MaoC/PaaZ C-terminal domain-containing protein [Spirochaetota bacterium]|nr:MaoC/PaaZ C-terminal domain-containing protein [Spirochaetota bacterium]HRZ28649.1 MaoC/PaaZ C-terminal domain-containing protein [Spirochaetota bacterium]